MGFNAGRSWADGTTALTSASQSVYIGSGAMGYNNSDVNSIVIGYLAKGIGANSVVLGNDSIITTALKGSVGIGTTTPDAILNIFGTTSTLLRIATSTNQGILVIGADGNASFGGTITSNSLLGGATNLTVDANGTIIRDTSDINLKEGISPITGALEKVMQLQGVTFNWKDKAKYGTQQEIGFVAQQVEGVIPQLVSSGGTYKSLKYTNMTALLAQAIKEQQLQITALASSTPLSVSGDTSSNFVTLSVQSSADFYGTITVRGEAGFESKVVFNNDIEVQGKIYASADQAGTATIMASGTSTEVVFAQEYEVVPKVTAQAQVNPNAFTWISDKTTKGFRINIAGNASVDIPFDWIVLAVKPDPNTTTTQTIATETVTTTTSEIIPIVLGDYAQVEAPAENPPEPTVVETPVVEPAPEVPLEGVAPPAEDSAPAIESTPAVEATP
jgi:hypothetical protein